MEQSNLLLEKRNDSFKMSNEQSQAKLLQAEQEKVGVGETRSDPRLVCAPPGSTGFQDIRCWCKDGSGEGSAEARTQRSLAELQLSREQLLSSDSVPDRIVALDRLLVQLVC